MQQIIAILKIFHLIAIYRWFHEWKKNVFVLNYRYNNEMAIEKLYFFLNRNNNVIIDFRYNGNLTGVRKV